MNRRILFVSIAALGVFAGGALLAGQPGTKTATKAQPTKGASAGATLPAGSNATEVYTALTQEIQTISQEAMNSGNPESQMKAFATIEAKLVAFRAKYPRSEEANDAAFQLGAMSFGSGKYKQAREHLTEFLAKTGESERDKVAYGRFYLAETNRAEGKYDAAEGDYKLILQKYRDINPKLTQIVQANLDGLGAERRLAIGAEPVAFNVKSTSGKVLSPAAFKGKVLLIDFWATWCGPCVAEMPNVKNVYSKYHAKGFEIVGISLDQSREKLDAYVKKNDLPWPQYFDGKFWNNDVAVMYGIKSIPTTVLVDKNGKIRYKSLRGKQLEAAVAELLNEKV